MREVYARTIESEHGDKKTVVIDEIESELTRVKHYMYLIIYVKSINNQRVCYSIH